jgi:hypothetical protein
MFRMYWQGMCVCINRRWLCCTGGDGNVPPVVAVLHRWWLCGSGGCSGVVCGESGMGGQTYKKCVCL